MARKLVGYREMMWTCPNCGTKNPGSLRTCKSCGSTMGEDVKFEQQTQGEIIKDEKIIEQAAQGPDIYCPYCGSRNPAGRRICQNCSASLDGGKERVHGTQHSAVMEARSTATIVCTQCGTENPAGSTQCRSCGAELNVSRKVEPVTPVQETPVQPAADAGKNKKSCSGCAIAIIVILAIFAVIGFLFLSGNDMFDSLYEGSSDSSSYTYEDSDDDSDYEYNSGSGSSSGGGSYWGGSGGSYWGNGGGSVQQEENSPLIAVVKEQSWTTQVEVIGPIDTQKTGWKSEMPSDATNARCEDRLWRTYDDEVSGSREVCGTPYAIDAGNGYEEIVQDCVYEVYKPYCQYTVTSSGVIDVRTNRGTGPNPQLPYVESRYSTGRSAVSYSVTLQDEDGQLYTYEPRSSYAFQQFTVGSEHELTVRYGRVVSVE